MRAAVKKHDDAYSAALERYNERVKKGDPTAKEMTFAVWCELNDPSVKALEDEMRTKTALFDVCVSGDGRPERSQVLYQRLSDAFLGVPNKPGLVQRGLGTTILFEITPSCLRD